MTGVQTCALPISVAVRADLGILQPSFGVALLTSKTDGALTLTAMVAHSRRSEHVWRKGGRPLGDDTEIIAANVFSWGGGAEFRVAPHGEVFVGVVAQTPSQQHESPRDSAAFAIAERSSWFVSAGYAVHWTMARPPRQVLGTMTTLRGIVLADPESDRFEVGEPGIYRAMVFLDASTRFVSGGNDVPRAELKQGRIVLVQGLALPHPSTFLARTIELQ